MLVPHISFCWRAYAPPCGAQAVTGPVILLPKAHSVQMHAVILTFLAAKLSVFRKSKVVLIMLKLI